MTDFELNDVGAKFSYAETQKAYKMLGIHKSVEDYPHLQETIDDDKGDYVSYFEDFDKWWAGLDREKKALVYEEVVGKAKKRLATAKIAVTGQLINMLENDIIRGYGVEGFEGWCADGEVFELNGLDKETVKECIDLVKNVSPLVDDLVMNRLNPNPRW